MGFPELAPGTGFFTTLFRGVYIEADFNVRGPEVFFAPGFLIPFALLAFAGVSKALPDGHALPQAFLEVVFVLFPPLVVGRSLSEVVAVLQVFAEIGGLSFAAPFAGSLAASSDEFALERQERCVETGELVINFGELVALILEGRTAGEDRQQ